MSQRPQNLINLNWFPVQLGLVTPPRPAPPVLSRTLYVGPLARGATPDMLERLALDQRIGCRDANDVVFTTAWDGTPVGYLTFDSIESTMTAKHALIHVKNKRLKDRSKPDDRLFTSHTLINQQVVREFRPPERPEVVRMTCVDEVKLDDLIQNGLGKGNFLSHKIEKVVSFKSYVADVIFDNADAAAIGKEELKLLALGRFSQKPYGPARINFLKNNNDV